MVVAHGANLVNSLLVELFIQSLALLRNLYEFLIVTCYAFFLSPPPVPSICLFPARFLRIFKLQNIYLLILNAFFLFLFSDFSLSLPCVLTILYQCISSAWPCLLSHGCCSTLFLFSKVLPYLACC